MTPATIWWLLAGAAVAAELLTGTFYLLMISLGMIAGALLAWAGVDTTGQLTGSAVTGCAAVLGWYWLKRRNHGTDPEANANFNLDVGETVFIDRWNADGTANVKYRGANWTAIHRPGVLPSAGAHRVSDVVGSRLLVEPLP